MRKNEPCILDKTHYVYLKPGGEVCNRLPAGTKVHPVREKEEWIQITWRNGKKKGWIERIRNQDPG